MKISLKVFQKKNISEKYTWLEEACRTLARQIIFWELWKSAGKQMQTEVHKWINYTKNKEHFQNRNCSKMIFLRTSLHIKALDSI